MPKWLVSKGGKGCCVTTVPYPPETVKNMKRAGYRVKEIPDDGGKGNGKRR